MKISIKLPWQAYLAEFIGTFIFVFVASGTVLTNVFVGDIGYLGVAFSSGLILAAMIYATIAISGGYLNPAITMALWLGEKISFTTAIFYIFAQILASFTAAYLLLWIFGSKSMQFALGGPILGLNVSVQSALIIEVILTGALAFAVFAIAVDKRGPVSFGPLVVGLIAVVSGIFAGPLTGAAMNPARAIGPLFVSQSYSQVLVWIVGPMAGSLVGFLYKFLFLDSSRKKH